MGWQTFMRWLFILIAVSSGAGLGIGVASASGIADFLPVNLYYTKNLTPYATDRPTLAKLRAIKDAHGFTRLDDLLEHLVRTQVFPRLFASPVLLHSSRSLLKAFVSDKFPRAIFHSDGFMAAVITDPAAGWAYDTLEMAEFDPATSTWRAEHLSFSPPPNALPACASCHRAPFIPKWGSYGVWDGAVGGVFDELSGGDKTRLAEWRRSSDQRLSWVASIYQKRKHPNFEFTAHVSSLQHRSLMQALNDSGVYQKYASAIYGALKGCEKFEDFFPPTLWAAHTLRAGHSLAAIRKQTAAMQRAGYDSRVGAARLEYGAHPLLTNPSSHFDAEGLEQTARLRFILEGQSLVKAMDIRRWGLSAKPGRGGYDFSNGLRSWENFLKREFLPVYEQGRLDLYPTCDDLAARSREELSVLK